MKSLAKPLIMAYMWVDRDCWYFISTASSLTDGNSYSRWRWRQPELSLEDMGLPNNQDTVRQQMTVPQPKACELYYNTCGSIDQHNRHRQDTLQMEKNANKKLG